MLLEQKLIGVKARLVWKSDLDLACREALMAAIDQQEVAWNHV